jgi:hypothetical protein
MVSILFRICIILSCVVCIHSSCAGTCCLTNSSAMAGFDTCKCKAGYEGPDGGPCTPCIANSASVAYPPNIYCLCNAGYTGFHGEACTACVSGKYKETISSFFCTDCAMGSSTPAGATQLAACTQCAAGKYTGIARSYARCDDAVVLPPTNQQSCLSDSDCSYPGCQVPGSNYGCWTGEGWGSSTNLCWQGDSAYTAGHCPSEPPCTDGCYSCSPNSISPTGSLMQSSCRCNMNYFGLDGGVCTACPANSVSEGGNGVCMCLAGYFGSDGGVCSACPENSASNPGSLVNTFCLCHPGYTGPNGGVCAACAIGKYKPQSGSAACTVCGLNSSAPEGSIAQSNCMCNAGYTGPNGGVCALCALGKYKSASG